MSNQKSFAGCPILLTHWDPDLYPARPLPLIPELVVQILAHGEVLLKEVDLFLNPKICAYLSDKTVFEQFSSLVKTNRIKILVPDASRDFEIDPLVHPFLATARERVKMKRPYKTGPWRMTRRIERFCIKLDRLFVPDGHPRRDGSIRQRRKPGPDNEFARTLEKVLRGKDKLWRQRQQFKGIGEPMAEQFLKFCENPDSAIEFLRNKRITPNATNGFYRSLLYQCADEFTGIQPRAMKNLGQSVYTHCELNRERAEGTYCGSRIAELPPTRTTGPDEQVFRVEVIPRELAAKIPVATNIGDIVSAVLEECGDKMCNFWALAGESPAPFREFALAWEQVADSFAKHAVTAHRAEHSRNGLWEWTEYAVRFAEILNEEGERVGVRWTIVANPRLRALLLTISTIATYGKPVMEQIRRGRVDAKQGEMKRILLDAATARCGRII